ncbi:MAG: hypothetical protein ACK532_04625 [Acidobacteriota bacterium]
MNPGGLLAPVSPSEAVAIAEMVLQTGGARAGGSKLAGRLPLLRLEKLRVYVGTLVGDPVQGDTFYLLVRAATGLWLLHVAPATAATTPLFPNPVLVARARPAGLREIVVNAIEVGTNLGKIVEQLYPERRARVTSVQSIESRPYGEGAKEFFARFSRRGNVLPGLRTQAAGWEICLPVLESGWAEGWVAMLEKMREPVGAEQGAPFSRFGLMLNDVREVRRVAEFEQAMRVGLGRSFDLELDLSEMRDLDLEGLHEMLDSLRLLGVGVQSVELPDGVHEGAFAALLDTRQIGMTVRGEGAAATRSRMHWKRGE